MIHTTLFSSVIGLRGTALKSLMLSLFILGAFMSYAGDAKAATFDLTLYGIDDHYPNGGDEVDWNDNGIIETNYNWTIANYTANVNKTTYAPGESITLSATAYTALCENFYADIWMTAWIDGFGEISILNAEDTGSQYGIQYGSGVITAPTIPGTYDIGIEACIEADWEFSGCTEQRIVINVVDPNLPPVTGVDPVGTFAAASCFVATGWACDSDNYTTPLTVKLYKGATLLGSSVASINTGSGTVSTACGGNSAHEFSIAVPEDFRSDSSVTVRAVAKNIGAGVDRQLAGVQTLICPLPDIAATMGEPVEGGIYKVGSQIPFDVTATNMNNIEIPEAGWAGIEVDIDSDDVDNNEYPWYQQYDNYYAVPNDTTKLGSFAIGQSKQFSYSIGDLPVGNHLVRFDVDVLDDISESDGWNNYSWNPDVADTTWRTVRVIGGELTLNPTSVAQGGQSSVSWTTENTGGMDCKVRTAGGVEIGSGASGNVSTGAVNNDITYILSCDSVLLSTPVVLDVVGATVPNLSVNTLTVEPGHSATLEWNTNNGDESLCALTGGALTTNPLVPTTGDVNTGSTDVVVDARTTYTLSCPTGTDTITVEIVPKGYES